MVSFPHRRHETALLERVLSAEPVCTALHGLFAEPPSPPAAECVAAPVEKRRRGSRRATVLRAVTVAVVLLGIGGAVAAAVSGLVVVALLSAVLALAGLIVGVGQVVTVSLRRPKPPRPAPRRARDEFTSE